MLSLSSSVFHQQRRYRKQTKYLTNLTNSKCMQHRTFQCTAAATAVKLVRSSDIENNLNNTLSENCRIVRNVIFLLQMAFKTEQLKMTYTQSAAPCDLIRNVFFLNALFTAKCKDLVSAYRGVFLLPFRWSFSSPFVQFSIFYSLRKLIFLSFLHIACCVVLSDWENQLGHDNGGSESVSK